VLDDKTDEDCAGNKRCVGARQVPDVAGWNSEYGAASGTSPRLMEEIEIPVWVGGGDISYQRAVREGRDIFWSKTKFARGTKPMSNSAEEWEMRWAT
jgi:hypothetical protein